MLDRQPLTREQDIARRVVMLMQERLPKDWVVTTSEVLSPVGRGNDLEVMIGPQGGPFGRLVAEIKRSYVPRDLESVTSRLSFELTDPASPLIVGRYLTPQVRQWLADRDISYCDATGNMRIRLDSPALFLGDTGASSDPWRGPGRPRNTLKGAPAARVVRALVDFKPPYSIPELVRLAESSTGPTYRVVDLLRDMDLLKREDRGPVEDVDWRGLIEAWSKDYALQEANAVGSFLQPRGVTTFLTDLQSLTGVKYAVTGSLAAALWAPYAPAKLAIVYADEPEVLVRQCRLRPVERGANVLLVTPKYDVVMARREWVGGVAYAAPSQVAVDLLTGPGRAPAEGMELLNWMGGNVDRWRKKPDR